MEREDQGEDRGGGLKILIIHRDSRAILHIDWSPDFSLKIFLNEYILLLEAAGLL